MPIESELKIYSGNIASFKIKNLGNKSETFLHIELSEGSKSFKISAYDLSTPKLRLISKQLENGMAVKAWVMCSPAWKCKAYRLFLHKHELFGLETIVKNHQDTWIRMSRGIFLIIILGIFLIVIELLLTIKNNRYP